MNQLETRQNQDEQQMNFQQTVTISQLFQNSSGLETNILSFYVTDFLCNYSVKDRFFGCPSDSRLGSSMSVLFPQIEVEFQQIEVYLEIMMK